VEVVVVVFLKLKYLSPLPVPSLISSPSFSLGVLMVYLVQMTETPKSFFFG